MAPASVSDEVRSAANDLVRDLEAVAEGHSPRNEAECYGGVAAAMDRCLARLARLELWGRVANELLSSELWNIAGGWLSRGWLQNRAREKPRGYAGDYELLARFYEGRLSDDPLGRHFDRYFWQHAAPQAVRNRMLMVQEWIVERAGPESGLRANSASGGRQPSTQQPLHIAIVGSAFGLEVRDALKRLSPAERQRLGVTLLDLDPAAIAFAEQQLAPLLAESQLRAESGNLFRLAERPTSRALLEGADWLFCVGLFDYLDDAAAAAMLRLFYERLAPGGRLTVFQFAPHNPSRAYMEWIANWYLIYRDEEQFRSLVPAAGLPPEKAAYGAEPLGVDLYVTVTRDS